MPTPTLPYRVRWLTAALYGTLLGAALTALAGTMGVAGVLSTQGWMTALIVAGVAMIGSIGALAQARAKIDTFNFIEKSVLLGACCGLIVGAFYQVQRQILSMRIALLEDPSKARSLSEFTPFEEQSLFYSTLYLSGVLLALATVSLAIGGMRKVKPWRGLCDNVAGVALLGSMSCLMFIGGRSFWFLAQAVGGRASWA